MLAYIVKLSADYSKLKTEVDQLKSRAEEDRRKADENTRKSDAKFTELFNSRNSTNDILSKLITTVDGMQKTISLQFTNLEDKIDTNNKFITEQINRLYSELKELKERN